MICRNIDNASVATLPLGTRGNLTTEAAVGDSAV